MTPASPRAPSESTANLAQILREQTQKALAEALHRTFGVDGEITIRKPSRLRIVIRAGGLLPGVGL